jgi:hypothetical protein
MNDTRRDAKTSDLYELTSDQLGAVSGGNDTANGVAYLVGHIIGEAAQIVKELGSAATEAIKKL